MSDLSRELAAKGATVLFSSHQLDLVDDLCQDVVIIEHGQVLRAGSLDGLRATVPQLASLSVGRPVGDVRPCRCWRTAQHDGGDSKPKTRGDDDAGCGGL